MQTTHRQRFLTILLAVVMIVSVAAPAYANYPVYDIEITKTDEDGTPMSGIDFAIYKNGSSTFYDIITTDPDGVAKIRVPQGEYRIEEMEAPDGYLLADPVTVFFDDDDEDSAGNGYITIVNYLDPGDPEPEPYIIEIYKQSEFEEPMGGVQFKMTHVSSGNEHFSWTDQFGLAAFNVDEMGEYLLEEVAAPVGFLLMDPQTIMIDEDTEMEQRIEVFNYIDPGDPEPYTITILKVDEDDAPMSGVPFTITDEGDGTHTVTTDQYGIATFETSAMGAYLIAESAAPDGYQLADHVTVTIDEDSGQEIFVKIINYPEDSEPEPEPKPEPEPAPQTSTGTRSRSSDEATTKIQITKQGPDEAAPADVITYTVDFTNRTNTEMTDFYMLDTLPGDVRALSLYTGIYSAWATFDVQVRTNYTGWTTLTQDVFTHAPQTLSLDAELLGLADDECITGIRFLFGTVMPGFATLDAPAITCTLSEDLDPGHLVTNNAEIGGTRGMETTTARSAWTTVIWELDEETPLPVTGY